MFDNVSIDVDGFVDDVEVSILDIIDGIVVEVVKFVDVDVDVDGFVDDGFVDDDVIVVDIVVDIDVDGIIEDIVVVGKIFVEIDDVLLVVLVDVNRVDDIVVFDLLARCLFDTVATVDESDNSDISDALRSLSWDSVVTDRCRDIDK